MKTILVAEDFHPSRKVIVNALTRNGYTALEAADGAEALELFDGRDIDLLIAEQKMPHMNGTDLAKAVHNLSPYKRIPVLVLSKESNDGKTDETAMHITAWVNRPFDLERFMKLVEKSIKQ